MSEAFDPYYTWLGIPPEDQPPDHYRLLGLRTFEANPDVIANAADRQMLMLRTFQAGPRSKESQRILNQISTAKVCLLDPKKKSDYDRQLSAAAETARTSSPTARPAQKAAARRKAAEPSSTLPVSQIVVTSDARPSIQDTASQKPAWQKPAVLGSAIAVVLALIIITAVTLAVSSNKSGTPVGPPDQESADSPPGLASDESGTVKLSDTLVANTGPSANPANHNPATPPHKIMPESLPDAPEIVQDDPQLPRVVTPVENSAPNGGESREPVDLLALIDVDRDVKQGRFVRQGNELISVAGSIHIQYQLPDEYILTAEVTRLQRDDALLVGLVIGGQPCMHLIDGFLHDGPCSGLELVDGKRVPENPTRRNGQFLPTGKSTKVVYTVRNDRLTVTVDSNTVTQWDGDPSRLRWHSFFPEPSGRNPFIGSWDSVIRFSKLELMPLRGGVAAMPVASAVSERSAEPVARLVIPDGEKQKVALNQVKDIFKSEYAAATSPDGCNALAEKLVEQSGEAGLDAAAKFVLLREAFTFAAEAVQPDAAFEAADQLGREYEIDALELKIKAIGDIDEAAWDVDSRKRVATAAMAVSRECLLSDRVPTAYELSEIAEDAATRSRDGELRIKARTWHADVRQFVKQWNLAEEAKKVLATQPDDAEANTQLGKYLCLTMNDWEEGLPHLAKTDRANLRQLVEMELAVPQAAIDKVALADAWWEAAKSAVSDEKNTYQGRARHWYQAALTELSGLQKIKVEKRLETLADVAEPLFLVRGDQGDSAHDAPRRVVGVAKPPQLKPDAALKAQVVPARKLAGHSVFVYEAMFSNDGAVIFTKAHSNAPGAERSAKIWSGTTGELIHTFDEEKNGFDPSVTTTISRDGKSLVAVQKSTPDKSWGDTLVFWDAATGERKKELPIPEQDLTVRGAPQFTPNGNWLAVGAEHGLALYDTSDWRRKKVVECFGGQASPWTVSNDLIAVTKFGKPSIECWSIESGEIKFDLPVERPYTAVSVSPDQTMLAGTPRPHEIVLHDLENRRTQHVLHGQMGSVRSTAFSPWGRIMASGDAYKKLILWDCMSGQMLHEVKCEGQVSVVAFSPDGKRLLSAQTDGQVLLWDVVAQQGP